MEYNNDIEIDFFDLIKWIFRHWYILLISAVIGAAIGCSFAAYKNTQASSTTPEQIIEKTAEALTPKEKSEVDDIISKINYADEKRTELYIDLKETAYSKDGLEDILKRADYWNANYNEQRSKVNSLNIEQKEYYAAINFDPDKKFETVSYIKFGALGFWAAFFLASGIYLVLYLFTPTVKTAEELSSMFKLPVLKNFNDADNKEKDLSMLSSDLSILLKRNSVNGLLIVFDSDSNKEKGYSELLCNALNTSVKGSNISISDPLSSANGLDELSSSDSLVILVSIKSTKHSRIKELLDYCSRYDRRIWGFVAV